MKNLLQSVQNDIVEFLTQQKMFFFNERDLQMNLALYLNNLKNRGYNVQLEYHIPASVFDNYPWDEKNISFDLVVEKDGKYVPIELKYKTRSLPVSCKISRFGEKSISVNDVVKNQSAQDIGRYGFWKDVKRLELLNKRFKNVVGGIAVFVTNDKNYTNSPKSSKKPLVGYYDFRMFAPAGNVITGHLSWRKDGEQTDSNIPAALRNFNLDEKYVIPQWQSYTSAPCKGLEANEMFYLTLIVNELY